MGIFISIVYLIVTVLGTKYIKKTIDLQTSIIYLIYCLLIYALWIIFILSYLYK